jgi:hypothetical protein
MPMKFVAYCRLLLIALAGISVLALLGLVLGPPVLDFAQQHPVRSLIIASIFVGSGVFVLLYMGELAVLGWIVDFIDQIGMPKPRGPLPLDYEQVGPMIVVTLPENLATVRQCQSIEKQLKDLINEHHCDFVFDFSRAEKLSRSFRQVLLYVMKAARQEAWNLGKPSRPMALRAGAKFKVFEDRQRALGAMAKHDGHGWVVLCGVPFGLRAVSKLT